jgi:hypothetical protein
MARHRHQPTLTRVATSLSALCAAGALLAGCGGSSPSPKQVATQAAPTQHAQPTPRQSNPDVGTASAQVSSATKHRASGHHRRSSQPAAVVPAAASGHASSGTTSRHQTSIRVQAHPVEKARQTPATTEDEHIPPLGPNPCTLVNQQEIESVVGGQVVARTEAPLGPTCIYRLAGAHPSVTVAVEDLRFPQVTSQMKGRAAVSVSGHQAYCGKLGSQMLFLPLGAGKVLNVTAPCGIAQRLAVLALARLRA